MLNQVTIGKYLVSTESETFHIFPKDKFGKTRRVTRQNQFLYVRHTTSEQLVVFKRYLHQGNWYWRDSRDKGPCPESHVLNEVSRMLYQGDTTKGGDLLLLMVLGAPLA